jgi:hypothetical protein
MTLPEQPSPALKPPLKPWVVLVVALLLPGMGQVLNNMPQRALTMVLFLVFLAMVSYHLTSPQHSWAGRHAGGIFVYGVMALDAYRWARYRWEFFHRRPPSTPAK